MSVIAESRTLVDFTKEVARLQVSIDAARDIGLAAYLGLQPISRDQASAWDLRVTAVGKNGC